MLILKLFLEFEEAQEEDVEGRGGYPEEASQEGRAEGHGGSGRRPGSGVRQSPGQAGQEVLQQVGGQVQQEQEEQQEEHSLKKKT